MLSQALGLQLWMRAIQSLIDGIYNKFGKLKNKT